MARPVAGVLFFEDMDQTLPPFATQYIIYKEEHLYLGAAYSRLFSLSSYFRLRKPAADRIRVLAEFRVNS